jgi:hypothetical protein
MRAALLLATTLLGAALGGCQDDLPEATLIEHMRVLGARIEVDGFEARSTPRPGESATMTWAVAFPELRATEEELESLFLVCTEPSSFTGAPVCEELIDLARTGGGAFGAPVEEQFNCEDQGREPIELGGLRVVCLRGTPRLEVPIERTFKARAKLVRGIICRNGVPRLDMESAVGASCLRKDGVRPSQVQSIPVYGTIPIAYDRGDENENPSRDRIEVRLRVPHAGAPLPWPAPTELSVEEREANCEATGDETGRDRFREFISIRYPVRKGEENKDLQFSTFTTFGELSQRFTILEAEDRQGDRPEDSQPKDDGDDIRPGEIAWSPTSAQREALEKPKLVRFYISVLDGRGGFDVTTRELCLARSDQ